MRPPSWIVCKNVTAAARAAIEANGGLVEILRETAPHLELVMLVDATPSLETEYSAWTLNPDTPGGVCCIDDIPELRTVYRWNGEVLDDPEAGTWESTEKLCRRGE